MEAAFDERQSARNHFHALASNVTLEELHVRSNTVMCESGAVSSLKQVNVVAVSSVNYEKIVMMKINKSLSSLPDVRHFVQQCLSDKETEDIMTYERIKYY